MEKNNSVLKEFWIKRNGESYEETMDKVLALARSLEEVPWLTIHVSKEEMKLFWQGEANHGKK